MRIFNGNLPARRCSRCAKRHSLHRFLLHSFLQHILLPPNTAMSSLAGALDLPPSTRPSDDIDMHSEDDDAAMSDLFGNKSVQPPFAFHALLTAHPSPAPASPTGSGPDSERLPSPERERRQALEYEEDDAPPEIAIEVKEAEVKFPNLPVPKPSDGDVRAPPLRLFTPSHFINRTGSSACPITSKSTPNPSTQIATSALNTTTTRACMMSAARRV